MKIAWFTPFSKNSAIGKYSQLVTNELIKKCDVDLWLSTSCTDILFTELRIFDYRPDEDLSTKLKNYDLIVYNMGNNLPFHKDIYDVSNKVRGIVILHDFVMQHFFAAYYQYKSDKHAYVCGMEILYGTACRDIASDSINGKKTPLWETEKIMDFPFFEKAIEGALGVVVHSSFLADKVRQRFLGPVEVIYHPFYSYGETTNKSHLIKKDIGIPEDKILILTVGHVNPNKRIDKVIEVLGKHKDIAEKVIYVVVGPYNHKRYYSELQQIIERYNLHSVVRFLGYQPDDVLHAYLTNSDIFVNLRYPVTEGASWSLIEQLYFGRPVIVNNIGFYSEIPDDCVLKINIDNNENENLYRVLKELVFEDKARENTGMKSKQFAYDNFTSLKYCQKFIDFLDKIKSWQPILGLVDKVSLELSLMGVLEDSVIVDRMSREIYVLAK